MKRIVAISPKAQKRICDWVRNRERDPGFKEPDAELQEPCPLASAIYCWRMRIQF